jgi:SAM-dependent methyltransferase
MGKYLFSGGVLMDIAKIVYTILYMFRKNKKQLRTFNFRGTELLYFEHPYNMTWKNERSIEIPIIKSWTDNVSPSKTLEIGNVFSHYFQTSHTIVDKYESRNGILQDDVISLSFHKKFDCIFSISTMEHVGWDESPQDPTKHIKAVENLKKHLSPNGKMIITIPLGYNPHFDESIMSEKLGCTEIFYLKRISDEEWLEVEKKEVINCKYGKPYRSANGLAVCLWE